MRERGEALHTTRSLTCSSSSVRLLSSTRASLLLSRESGGGAEAGRDLTGLGAPALQGKRKHGKRSDTRHGPWSSSLPAGARRPLGGSVPGQGAHADVGQGEEEAVGGRVPVLLQGRPGEGGQQQGLPPGRAGQG